MSTGAPKEQMPENRSVSQIGGLAVRSSIDMCKGCRMCCKGFIKTLAASRIATGICIVIPMIAMTALLIYIESSLAYVISMVPALNNVPRFYEYKILILSPLYG